MTALPSPIKICVSFCDAPREGVQDIDGLEVPDKDSSVFLIIFMSWREDQWLAYLF